MGTFASEQLMGRHTDGISRTSNVHAASPKISKQLQQAVGLSLPPVSGTRASSPRPVCVFITAGPSTKLFTWGGWDMGGHVLRETTSRGLCGLGCPSRTSERGGEGDCVKGGGGEEGKCERERALERLRYYNHGH
jgi:hypothetical protein